VTVESLYEHIVVKVTLKLQSILYSLYCYCTVMVHTVWLRCRRGMWEALQDLIRYT